MTPHWDRLRAAVMALENFDVESARCVEPITEFNFGSWRCGTTACAGGMFALHPAFRKRGLGLTRDTIFSNLFVPVYEGQREALALAKFFNISTDLATHWFILGPYSSAKSSCDVTPQDVADDIRAYLRKSGQETGRIARQTVPA